MKPWVKDPAFLFLGAALLGVFLVGCSAPSQGTVDLFGEPSPPAEREPLDPHAPGASIICDVPAQDGGDPDVRIYVISAMNHKLDWYPDFAAAAGIGLVADCDSANRFAEEYAKYSTEHPTFDVNEPLPPSPDGEAPGLPDDAYVEPDVSKIGGVPVVATDNAVVRLSFETCTQKHAGGARCPKADISWIIHPGTPREEDLRRDRQSCTGTLISKNWVLTSAHCITTAAIDHCLEEGTRRDRCSPSWDNYGRWTIQGEYFTDLGSNGLPDENDVVRPYTEVIGMRSYVETHWNGITLSKNSVACDGTNPDPCFDSKSDADHDLALLYIDWRNDNRLPPRVEDDAAKRLNIVPGTLGWHLAAAGWGTPLSNNQLILRKGDVSGDESYPAGNDSLRVEMSTPRGGVYACPGDSGGPILRTGLGIATNRGGRDNLDAVVAVMSGSTARCGAAGTPPDLFPVKWLGTLVQPHLGFIHDQLKRWPATVHTCTKRRPSGAGRDEVEECWGKPCNDLHSCATNEACLGDPRITLDNLPSPEPMCRVCKGFGDPDFDENVDCNCIEGQCVPVTMHQ